jgi:hypothetical protein
MFVKNPSFASEMGKSEAAVEALKEAASTAASPAEGFAHHAMPRRGHRRIEVVEADGEVYLVNTNFGGALEEHGSVNSPIYAPLRRGVLAAGFRFASHD